MSVKKIATGASQVDVDIANALELPTPGCNGGPGPHIVIPVDYMARIALGQLVPGCTHSRLESDGSLFVSDRVQAQLAIPAVVNGLTAAQQTEANLLVNKLSLAVVST